MSSPRRRFTTQDWMVLILAIALLLAIVTQVVERRRRQAEFLARTAQLRQEFVLNQRAQAALQASIEAGRQLSPGEEREVTERRLEDLTKLQERGRTLQQKLSQLRP